MFNEKVEDYMIRKGLSHRDREYYKHYPSEASHKMSDGSVVGKCLRARYFEAKGYTTLGGISIKSLRAMAIGKAIEGIEIARAKEMGIHVADDAVTRQTIDGMLVSGKIDAIYKDDDENFVCIEYKTSSGYTFERDVYGKFGKLRAEPRPDHVLQLMLYLHMRPDLKYGVLYYINRDKLDAIEHKVELIDGIAYVNNIVTEFTVNGIINRYKHTTKCLRSNTIPECDYSPAYTDEEIEKLKKEKKLGNKVYEMWQTFKTPIGHWRCKFCEYNDKCIEQIAYDENLEKRVEDKKECKSNKGPLIVM